MNGELLTRYRCIAALMEAYADDRQPTRAERIHDRVLSVGESVETARMIARYSRQPTETVTLTRK